MTARRDIVPRFVKGFAAVLESWPPFDDVANEATVRVGTPSTPMPTSGVSATIDQTLATTTADALQGATTMAVDAGGSTIVAGRLYYVVIIGGDSFPVEALGVSGSTLSLAEPLPMAVPSGTTLIGNTLSIALSADDTATIGEGVAEWYAVDGNSVEHKWTTHFRIVERDAQYTLTPTTLTSSSPYCAKNRPDSDTDYTETIDAAWRRYVYPKLLAKALRPERIVGGEHFEAVHIAACEFYLAVEFDDDAEKRAERKALLADAMETVLLASDLWISPVAEDLSNTTDVDTPGVGAGAAYSVTFISR